MTLILRERTLLELLRQFRQDLAKTVRYNPKQAESAAREAGSLVGSALFVGALVLLVYLLGTFTIWWNWPG